MKSYPLNDQQHATVIAALRFYQEQGQTKGWRSRDIDDIATNGGSVGALEDAGVDALIEHLQFGDEDTLAGEDEEDFGDPDKCECGAPTDDGEGYAGKCGNCADRDYADDHCSTCGDELGDDSYEGLCSDCAEHEIGKHAARGMAANPKPTKENAPNQPT